MLISVYSDASGEVRDQPGTQGKILAPDGMIMKRFRYAGKPRQRTGITSCELWEAPVEDGGHVGCGLEVASAGRRQQLAEWMFSGFGCQRDQVGSQGWPGGFSGEPGEVLVGLVELCDGLGSEELFGCDVEAVGVALDRLEEPGRWIVELAQHPAGGDGLLIATDDLL